ncbi:sensor domain-containing protein [Speluncibacter jeojiensis]|uniref:DUF3558 domain-containing protein n=1 Tax=Speluncibacter jeojiensis TaxID=2710754 RepID=A0A9X4RIX7_9ACTN|nr:DUF3558 domain-containing protein [Corynebacteriales bacterium D3-21]
MVLAGVMGAAVLLVAGCSSTVGGRAIPASGHTVPAASVTNLDSALPAPASFPAGYTATPLPQDQAREAAADLSRVPGGSRVTPLHCEPPRLPTDPADLAMTSATNTGDGSVLAVLLTRVDEPLTTLSKQVARCTEMTATQFGAKATVRRTTEPTPSAPGADDTFAYGQTTTSGPKNLQLTQTTFNDLAQVGDVRVTVTFMSQRGAEPDRKAVGELLSATVANLRR